MAVSVRGGVGGGGGGEWEGSSWTDNMNTQVGRMRLAGMDTILLHGFQLPEAQCPLRSRSHRHELVLLRHMRVTLYLFCAQKHACCLPKHLLEHAAKHCFVRTCLSKIA